MTAAESQDRYDEKTLAHFQERLLEERARTLRDLGVATETLNATQQAQDGGTSKYRFHMADHGTDTQEQEKAVLLASKEGRLLMQIDEALRHLYRSPETFGKCSRCEQLIDYERLDTLPHTRLCITCKQRVESGEDAAVARNADADASAQAS